MSFDQDPGEQAQISGGDLALMVAEMNGLRAQLENAHGTVALLSKRNVELVGQMHAAIVCRNTALNMLESSMADGHTIQWQAGRRSLLDVKANGMQATRASMDVFAERHRQVAGEGWTPEHDDEHGCGELASAAGCYAMFTTAYPPGDPVTHWPWDRSWWKPSPDRRRNLVKAGALILAEIERLDRVATKATTPSSPSII